MPIMDGFQAKEKISKYLEGSELISMLSIVLNNKTSPKIYSENHKVNIEWEDDNQFATPQNSYSSSSDSVFQKNNRNSQADQSVHGAKISSLEQKRPLIYALTADIDPSIVEKIASFGFKKAFD